MMKKYLLLLLVAAVTLVYLPKVQAQVMMYNDVSNPLKQAYGNKKYEDKELKKRASELIKFGKRASDSSSKLKTVEKVKAEYDAIKAKYPEEGSLIDLAWGKYLLNCPADVTDHIQGYQLIAKAMQQVQADSLRKLRGYYLGVLALCNLQGDGVEKNPENAFQLYQQANDLDSLQNDQLAIHYLLGIGTPRNQDMAYRYFLMECLRKLQNPDETAYVEYAEMCLMAITDSSDVDQQVRDDYYEAMKLMFNGEKESASKLMKKAADAGLLSAQYRMGGNAYLYHLFMGYALYLSEDYAGNYKIGQSYLEKSAANGFLPAVFFLGNQTFSKETTFVWQQNQNQANAYSEYFYPLSQKQYGPAIVVCDKYDRYGWKKTANLAADVLSAAVSVAGAAKNVGRHGLAGLSNSQQRIYTRVAEGSPIDLSSEPYFGYVESLRGKK